MKPCLVAIGPGKGAAESKEDHNCIFEKLRFDLDALEKNFEGTLSPFSFASRKHDGNLRDFYLCKEVLFAEQYLKVNSNVHIMDNPERRANFGLNAGNSNNHRCFGLSCNFSKLKLPFQACKQCCNEIRTYVIDEGWMDLDQPLPKCKKCHGFSMDHLLQYGEYTSPLHTPKKHIKQSELPGNHLLTRPGKLTNKLLIEAYFTARDMFLSGRMSEKSVREYLAVLCFNTHTVTTLVEGCRLYQLSLDVEVGCTDITADDRSIVSEAKDKSPNGSIEKPSPPPMLYICDLDCSIEAIMHLGMNVTKHCCQAAFNWSKDIPGFSCTELIQGAQQFIKSIDSLKVSDFAVMGFKTEEMGGYVAETYRAYLQLAPWTFRWINQYEDSRNQNWIQQLDVQKLNSWTKLNMLSFLSVRGINIKRQMFKNELIDKVMENKNLPELQTFKAFSGADMREMMLVLNCFVSALFATDITGKQAKNRLSALARMYLTFSSRLDMFLMKTTPSWITTFSLLGMLRSADTFSLAPYPICFYEGDGMGEGIIKEIRPIILTGLRKGWTLSGQGTYYRMQTLTYMQDVLLSKSSLDLIAPKKRPVRAMTKVYKYFCNVDDALDI